MEKQTIYVVATPIGNLEDISQRALQTLAEVDFICCEDTRVTGFLLNHFNIKKELISFNAHSEIKKTEQIIERLKSGASCALVSDAGTPSISDPGVRFISAALNNDIMVRGIPGANAAITALSIAGLPTDSFVFEGFLPQKKGRQKKLQELTEEERTIVLYESVYRIEKLLTELDNYMPERFISVHRELTKKFEEAWRGKASEILAELKSKTLKGEFVIVISPLKWKY